MFVLVDVRDDRYSSGLRVQTWKVECITKEIYEELSALFDALEEDEETEVKHNEKSNRNSYL